MLLLNFFYRTAQIATSIPNAGGERCARRAVNVGVRHVFLQTPKPALNVAMPTLVVGCADRKAFRLFVVHEARAGLGLGRWHTRETRVPPRNPSRTINPIRSTSPRLCAVRNARIAEQQLLLCGTLDLQVDVLCATSVGLVGSAERSLLLRRSGKKYSLAMIW